MKEILGNNLEQAFKDLNISAKKTFQSKIKRYEYEPEYQVWELSEKDFEKLDNINNEDWKNTWGWWQYSKGSNIEDDPIHKFKINNCNIVSYYDEYTLNNYVDDYLEDEYIKECNGNKDLAKEQLIKEFFNDTSFWDSNDLTGFIGYMFGASMPRNVCAIATSLARLNNITLGKLFNKYQG